MRRPGANAGLFLTEPKWSAAWAAALAAWFGGIFVVALPWTLAKLPRLAKPSSDGRRPALD